MLFRTNCTRNILLSGVVSKAFHTVPVISRVASKFKTSYIGDPDGTLNKDDGDETSIKGAAQNGEEDLSRFDEVFDRIDFGKVSAYASAIRKSLTGEKTPDLHDTSGLRELDTDCDLEGVPLYGSFHVLFPLAFNDGTRWILKVPAAGYEGSWDSLAANALRSEALMMRKLSSETTIPVPAVYSFNTSLENELNCPFILMQYMNGTPLYHGWFNEESESLESFRARALETLASATVQLNAYKYSKAGAPCFDDDGVITDITASRVYDTSTMYHRLGEPECDEPTAFCNIGPFTDMRDQLLYLLDRHRPFSKLRKGMYEICRLFIQWLPKDVASGEGRFVLTHPDLDLQNVLVSDDGTLRGLIDWDGVAASSVMLGCRSYPLWLTRDWTAQMYNYDTETGQPKVECYPRDNSPEELAYYRNMYSQFMEKIIEDKVPNGSERPMFRPAPTTASAPTRKSLIVAGLDAAANDPMCTWHVVDTIFDEIRRLTAPKWKRLIAEEEEEEEEVEEEGSDDDKESSELNGPEMEDVSPAEQPDEDGQQSIQYRCDKAYVTKSQYECDGNSLPDAMIVPDGHEGVCKEPPIYHGKGEGNPHALSGDDELSEDARCNEVGSGVLLVGSSDAVAADTSDYGSVLPAASCTAFCNPYFCFKHKNIKAPPTLLKMFDSLRSVAGQLPSHKSQKKRHWLRVPSIICCVSDGVRTSMRCLPKQDAHGRGHFHIPHGLLAASTRMRNLTKVFYDRKAESKSVRDPQVDLPISSTVSKPTRTSFYSRINLLSESISFSSTCSFISKSFSKTAQLLYADGVSKPLDKSDPTYLSSANQPAILWLDVAREMQIRGVAAADLYKHSERIAALIQDTKTPDIDPNGPVPHDTDSKVLGRAATISPDALHKIIEADSIADRAVQKEASTPPCMEDCPKQGALDEEKVQKEESITLDVEVDSKEASPAPDQDQAKEIES
ncbi:MAG: hypothetical protein Q9191_004072, partial [Dirinaria sp. TL-2023a]